MLKDKEKGSNKIDSLIGQPCYINGILQGDGILKIDGTFEGSINWQDDIILGHSGSIKGDIICKNAFISGRVQGNIICENILTIENLGFVTADINVKNIIIKDGGFFEGKCTMITCKNYNKVTE